MVAWLPNTKHGAIGVDIGGRSVKLLQFNAPKSGLADAGRWELSTAAVANREERRRELGEALRQLRQGREFRGREAVLSLGAGQLFVQNVRVPKASGEELEKLVRREAEGRLPFPADEAELRFLEAADVRQGETTRREVILLACHRPVLDELLSTVVDGGLRPVAVDVEPLAVLRCYCHQYRREDDHTQRVLYVRVGASNTLVIIARGFEPLFIKYLDVGGRQMDEALARYLGMELADASTLRRNNGDRRAEQQDPEVSRSVQDALRPIIEQLADELSMCVRYHSVTFRGQPLSRIVVTGGEAWPAMVEALSRRIDLKLELGDPLRPFDGASLPGRKAQWDVAAGLALRS